MEGQHSISPSLDYFTWLLWGIELSFGLKNDIFYIVLVYPCSELEFLGKFEHLNFDKN